MTTKLTPRDLELLDVLREQADANNRVYAPPGSTLRAHLASLMGLAMSDRSCTPLQRHLRRLDAAGHITRGHVGGRYCVTVVAP